MKNISTKVLCFVLAIVLIYVTGCGEGKISDSTSEESPVTSSETESPKIDLGGAIITIATDEPAFWGFDQEGLFVKPDSFKEDWRRGVEEKYNCVIEVITYDRANALGTIQPKLMAGDKFADIFDSFLFVQEPLRKAGLLDGMSSISTLDLNHPNFIKSINDYYTFNDIVYGTHTALPRLFGVFFNKEMIKRLDLKDPYELVEQDNWNYENFREMCQAATIESIGQYGLGAYSQFEINMLAANGAYIAKKVDGKIQYTLNSPQTIEAMTFMSNIFLNDKLNFPIANWWDWKTLMDSFAEGKILFHTFYHTANDIILEMEDEFGFLPLPKGPSVDKYFSLGDTWTNILSVPINLNKTELDNVGYLLMELADRADEEREIEYEDFQYRVFRGDEAPIRILKLMRENVIFDYSMLPITSFGPAYNTIIIGSRLESIDIAAALLEIDELMSLEVADYYADSDID